MSKLYSYPGSKVKAGIFIDTRELEMEVSHMMERLLLERDKLMAEQGLTKKVATTRIMSTITNNADFYKSAVNKQISIISEQLKQAVTKPIRDVALKEKGAVFAWILGSVKTSHCPDCLRLSSKEPRTINEWLKFGVGLPREGLTECNIGCRCMLNKVEEK